MTQNKKILIVFIVIAIIVIGVYVYRYFSLPKATKDENGNIIPSYSDPLDLNKTISFGEKGSNVVRLQTEINNLITKFNYPLQKLSTDGMYGNKTAEALKIVSNGVLNGSNVTINKVIALGVATPVNTIAPPNNNPTLPSAPTYS